MHLTNGLPPTFNPNDYDAIIVGAGFAGSVCARTLAESPSPSHRGSNRIALFERRPHLGGMAHDFHDPSSGILIHQYGPHIYHTSNPSVHAFLSRFTTFTPYHHRVLANIHGTLVPLPFNHQSLLLSFGPQKGERLYQKVVHVFGEGTKVSILELRKHQDDDEDLREIAEYVYENVFLHYTKKQWGGKSPDQIDPSVLARVPILIGDDDPYFPKSKHQGMPTPSYTSLFENMLDHPNISVFTNVEARDVLAIKTGAGKPQLSVCGAPYAGEVVYTGALDELFGLDLGALPYRTVDMVFETLDQDRFQPCGVVNYTVSEEFIRITEFKNITGQIVPGKTTIMREYSKAYEPGTKDTPFYIVNEPKNMELYRRYRERVAGLGKFHVVGRLAEYRYYNMDEVVASAMALAERIIDSSSK